MLPSTGFLSDISDNNFLNTPLITKHHKGSADIFYLNETTGKRGNPYSGSGDSSPGDAGFGDRDSGYPRPGYVGSGYTGSDYADSGYATSGDTGSDYADSNYANSGYTGSSYAGSSNSGSGGAVPADTPPFSGLLDPFPPSTASGPNSGKSLIVKSYNAEARLWTNQQTLTDEVSCFTGTGFNSSTILATIHHHGSFELHRFSQPRQEWYKEEFYCLDKDKTASHPHLLAGADGSLHLIYLVNSRKNTQWCLMHHLYNGRKWEDSKVIDFGGSGNLNYGHVVMTGTGNIHIVYRIQETKQTRLYYRTFYPYEQSWSRGSVVAADKDISFPCLLADTNSYLHLIWCACHSGKSAVRYRRRLLRGWPAGRWGNTTELFSADTPRMFPWLSYGNDILWATWITPAELYRRKSYHNGEYWEDHHHHREELNKNALLHRLLTPGLQGGPMVTEWAYARGFSKMSGRDRMDRMKGRESRESRESKESMHRVDGVDRANRANNQSNNTDHPERVAKQKSTENQMTASEDTNTRDYSTGKSTEIIKEPGYQTGKNSPSGIIIADDPISMPALAEENGGLRNSESAIIADLKFRIKELEGRFQHRQEAIKKKYDTARRAWEEENLRLLKENQQYKKEIARLKGKNS